MLPIVYVSPYYKPDIHSGANRRLSELAKRFVRDYNEQFTLVVSKGCAPDWWNGKNLIEVEYNFNHISKFTAMREIGNALDALPPSIVIIESIPIPFKALERHVHFQVAYDFRYFHSFSKSFFYRLLFSPYLKNQWRRSEYMVTSTEFSIHELQKHVGYPRDRVIQSYFGIDENLLNPKHRTQTEKTIDILYVSHFDGHKNHAPLLHAVAKLNPALRMFLIGRDNGKLNALLELKEKLGLKNTIITTESKTDSEMWNLYRSSNVFTFPTLYEGFGMPLIEALALGIPTTCSDIPVFREIAGDLVTYYNPHDPDDIARVLDNALTKGQPQSLEKVRAQVEKFTWDNIYTKFVADLKTFAAKSDKKQ